MKASIGYWGDSSLSTLMKEKECESREVEISINSKKVYLLIFPTINIYVYSYSFEQMSQNLMHPAKEPDFYLPVADDD